MSDSQPPGAQVAFVKSFNESPRGEAAVVSVHASQILWRVQQCWS